MLNDQRKNFLRFVALGMDSVNIYPFLEKLKKDQQKLIDKFIKDMEKFLQEKLTDETTAFIRAKKQLNWALYEDFKAITRLNANELGDASDLVKALYICIHAQDDYKKVKDLLKKYA